MNGPDDHDRGKESDAERLPPSPLTPLGVGAASTYEMFTSYRQAGFTEAQALRLLAEIMAAHGQRQPPDAA